MILKTCRVAEALRICDEGNVDAMAAQWAHHPPALWVALAATAATAGSERCLDWMMTSGTCPMHVLVGVARAADARVNGGISDDATTRAALHLKSALYPTEDGASNLLFKTKNEVAANGSAVTRPLSFSVHS